MIWPFGELEIEERRPKSWNEPRRKRLSFVKSHKKSSSENWALAPSSNPRRINAMEMWDHRQREAQQRFIEGYNEPPLIRRIDPNSQHPQLGPPARHDEHMGAFHGDQGYDDHDMGGGIMRVDPYYNNRDPYYEEQHHGDQYHDDAHPFKLSPKIIDCAPRSSRPRQIQIPDGGDPHVIEWKERRRSPYSSDSDDDDFVFRPNRKSSKHHRRSQSRGRSRSRFAALDSDDEYDKLEYRTKLRKGSRRRRS